MSSSHPQDSSTTPLGGSSRRQIRRERLARSWTGYVPLVRTCPACETENDQHNQFCVGCAAPIGEVQPAPSINPESGVRAMEERIRRENDAAGRSRPFSPDAGTGLLITGAIVILIAIWFPFPTLTRLVVWAAGIGFTGTGLYRMRFDGGAIRRSGIILAATSIGLAAIVVTQGTPPTDPASLQTTAVPTQPGIAAATPVATPEPSLEMGSVPSLLGDPGHSGLQPGPAPAENPSLAWRFDTGSEILSSPVVAEGMVFITNREGFLYAVDAISGQQRWRANVGPYVLRTTPTYAEGMLYLVAGFDALAIDAETGEERWRTTIRYAGTGSPTVADGVMYTVSQEGWLYALSADDGTERWKTTTDGISLGSPSITGNRLIIGTDRGTVIGVNAETGRFSWRRDLEAPVYTTPVISGSKVWVVTTDGLVRSLDLETGEEMVAMDTTSDLTVAASEDILFSPSSDGGLYAIDSQTEEVIWFASAGGELHSGPVLTDTQVIVPGGNRVAGFDQATGEQLWYFLAGDTIESPPAIVSGYVFFGARDGLLYAVTDNP